MYEADGKLNDDTTAGDLVQDYKAQIAALARLAGKLAFENEFQKGVFLTKRYENISSLRVASMLHVMPSNV